MVALPSEASTVVRNSAMRARAAISASVLGMASSAFCSSEMRAEPAGIRSLYSALMLGSLDSVDA
ncbi:hypothetical protein D9M69_653300 [compost metagenome]